MDEHLPKGDDDAWRREHWSAGGGDALLFYVIYGVVDVSAALDRSKYRTTGIPDEMELHSLTRSANGKYLKQSFEEGHPWQRLMETNPALAGDVIKAEGCLILQGTVQDPPTLEYLRNAIGLITFFLDHGGVAVYDIQVMRWWTPAEWRRDVFGLGIPDPGRHVVILYSNDDVAGVGTWFHTRGMRKFGRPDISVRDVPPHQFEAVVDLCNRFITYQAYGALIPEGRSISIPGLERTGIVRHRGHEDDDDFNNVHFEVEWHGDA